MKLDSLTRQLLLATVDALTCAPQRTAGQHCRVHEPFTIEENGGFHNDSGVAIDADGFNFLWGGFHGKMVGRTLPLREGFSRVAEDGGGGDVRYV